LSARDEQIGIKLPSNGNDFGESVIEMTTVATVRSELRDLYARESAAIEQEFSVTGEGRTALARRTALVDSIVQRLWNEIIVGSSPATDSGFHPPIQTGPRISRWWPPADSGAAGFFPTPTSICCFCTPEW
jgi:hypothetical protein